jgi:catechol 2,3-dioxygenase-like lactoylglutathione lyase family enzyme
VLKHGADTAVVGIAEARDGNARRVRPRRGAVTWRLPDSDCEAAMATTGMNHFTILTDDVPRTVAFYADLLGLADGPRPDLGFPGAWMYAGGQAVLHVVGGRSKDALKPGVIDHVAFSATGLAATLARLETHGVDHVCRQQTGTGLWQVFFHDPNGARVELDFAAYERG